MGKRTEVAFGSRIAIAGEGLGLFRGKTAVAAITDLTTTVTIEDVGTGIDVRYGPPFDDLRHPFRWRKHVRALHRRHGRASRRSCTTGRGRSIHRISCVSLKSNEQGPDDLRAVLLASERTKRHNKCVSDYISWLRSKVGHEPVILVGVSAVIQNEKGEVLLVKRGDNGTWACPGGIMEPGERVRETLAREVTEELGTEIAIGDLLGVYSNRGAFKYPNGDISYNVGIFFVCTIRGESKVDGVEALEARFFYKHFFLDAIWGMQE